MTYDDFHHDPSVVDGIACTISPLVQAERVETRLCADGRLRYRIKGIAMAWCNSLIEAVRIGHILIRSGRVPYTG